jgi:hypothetical protein
MFQTKDLEKNETHTLCLMHFSVSFTVFEVKGYFFGVLFHNSTTTGLILIKYYIRGSCSSVLSVLCYLHESIKNYISQIENYRQ